MELQWIWQEQNVPVLKFLDELPVGCWVLHPEIWNMKWNENTSKKIKRLRVYPVKDPEKMEVFQALECHQNINFDGSRSKNNRFIYDFLF